MADGNPAQIRYSRKTKEQYVMTEVDGKATGWKAFFVAPPELREFALLERDGWLGALLQADELACLGQAGGHPLLASDRARPDRATLSAWLESLAALMARMGDSLDEC
jgi:hypothetical protein